MAGLFGIGGSSAKTDRNFQLQSWGDLSNLFNTQNQAGTSLLNSGTTGLGQASNYWQALMSGDPTKMSQVLAPQISAIKGQTGQNIAGIQQFQGRSGSTAGAVEAENVSAQTAIQNLFDMLGPEAAQQFTQLSEFETGAGSGLLSEAGSTAGTLGSEAGGARTTDQQMQQQQQAAVMEALVSLAGI